MTQVLRSAEQIDPAWLSHALKAAGALEQGEVVHIELIDSGETGPSVISRLAVRYSSAATGALPEHLFVKIPKPHKVRLGRNEAEFYRRTQGLPHRVPCYGAAHDEVAAHLILADLSDTHSSGGALTVERATAAVDALAVIQAHFWNHADLGRHLGAPPEAGFVNRYSDRHASNKRRFAQLLELHGEAITPAVRALYETVLDKAPDVLLARAAEGDLTLGHHDLHMGNMLFPTDPTEPVYIVDWQNDWAWFGVKDLAFLLVFAWEEAQCRALEQDLLRRYCDGLAAAGVAGFSWDRAWRDYRLAAIELLFRPLGNRESPDALRQLARCTQAFVDLECMELL